MAFLFTSFGIQFKSKSEPGEDVSIGNRHNSLPFADSSDFFSLKRNCVFAASSGSRETNQVNPVNPVRKHFGSMAK
jgi:hypothetical protein